MLNNIPEELRALPQWVVAAPDKTPLNPHTLRAASVTDMTTWGTFKQAVQAARGGNVGFVFTKGDPFAFIDLDYPLNQEQANRHQRIADAIGSYTEVSISGKGCHIIVRGAVPRGVRRDKVEVYSSERYAIMTGNVWKGLPITDQQQALETLYREMGGEQQATLAKGMLECDAMLSDAEVYDMACRAANSAKFLELWQGRWKELGYDSQSQADQALMDMLCFYSVSNEQCRRMFRTSALGQRKKAERADYVNNMIRKFRSEQPPPVDLSALRFAQDAPAVQDMPEAGPVHVVSPVEDEVGDEPALGLPPGLLGACADFIYRSAYHPIPEAAVAGAVALLAGIAGRQYNVSQSGLNQYVVLLAASGTGKEAAASGMSKILQAMRQTIPASVEFMGPARFGSGAGLLRALSDKPLPSMVSVIGEVAITMRGLFDRRAALSDQQLLQVLLDLYAKSGWGQMMNPTAYSDTQKNTKLMVSPCLTLLGESVPHTFYNTLTPEAVSGGLVPRMLVLEYTGDAMLPNRAARPVAPPQDVTQALCSMTETVLRMAQNNTCADVLLDAQAAAYMQAYEDDTIARRRGDVPNEVKELWSRANMKALKLAALAAVSSNWTRPMVSLADAEWAVDLVGRSTRRLLAKLSAGDIGVDEDKQEASVLAIMRAWKNKRPAQRLGCNAPRAYANQDKFVPLSFILREARRRACFAQAQFGPGRAIEQTLQGLVRGGTIGKVGAMQLAQNGLPATAGEAYYMANEDT